MIVATAGHIDHGKTHLVRALTGVETDRLPEERARGISIDLGFAYWAPPGGALIGFVDVPGHERFVRNMVAGVCGIDYALLVVAADDGIMPQTVEHLQILDLLDIRRGVAVMTKVDRVDPSRRREVRADILARVSGTTLDGIDVFEASPVTSEGLDAVARALRAAAESTEERFRDGQYFRFAVDRAFSVEGSGTVVTGTVFSGELSLGARLRVSPGGASGRARRLRVHASEVDTVRAGLRCAINLAGVGVADVARGDWVVAEAIHRPTQRIDAELTLLPGLTAVPSPATRVHLHIGAGDVMARIVSLGEGDLVPGTRAFVHVITDAPVGALHGDRFILRDSAAHRTLGGGTVLDPFADGARRRRKDRIAALAALAGGEAHDALRILLDAPGGVNLERFEAMFNLVPDAAQALYDALDGVVVGRDPRFGIRRDRHAVWSEAMHARLSAFHARHPAVHGMRVKELRDSIAPALPLSAFESFLHGVASSCGILVRSGIARLAEHDVTANPGDRALWERVYPVLRGNGAALLRSRDLAKAAGVDVRELTDLMHRRRTAGTVFRIGEDRFCLRTTLAALASTAATLAQLSSDGTFTVALYRDAIGTGRMLAIEILECLDRVGATLRAGDTRRMRHDYVDLLGEATPRGDLPSAIETGCTHAADKARAWRKR